MPDELKEESAAEILMAAYTQRVEGQRWFLNHMLGAIAGGGSVKDIVGLIADALDSEEWHDAEMMWALNTAREALDGDSASPQLRKLEGLVMRFDMSAVWVWSDGPVESWSGGYCPGRPYHDVWVSVEPREAGSER